MAKGTLGEQELALLRHVADAGPSTVGEVADRFGTPRGLARSTVLTMMERLRHKGHLGRRLADGLYRYRASESSTELVRGVVRRFVERTLGGSVSPLVAYLDDTAELSDEELRALRQVVERLSDARRRKEEKS
jgi:predicted transcriptional regulator